MTVSPFLRLSLARDSRGAVVVRCRRGEDSLAEAVGGLSGRIG